MTVNADSLRHLAAVVDELQETPIDVDGARVLNATDDELRAQVALTIPMDATLEIGEVGPAEDSSDGVNEIEEDEKADREDNPEVLDHTSTEDLQYAYDEADGRISEAAEHFEVSYSAVFKRMKDHGVHTPNSTAERDTATEDDTTESLSEARTVDLEADVADDAPETDAGDDVQDEPETEIEAESITVDAIDDGVTCDGCGEHFDSREALQGHGPKACSGGDGPDVELPDGVTPDDVRAVVAECETLGDVGQEIGVTRGRARTITVALGCYGDVRDVPSRDRASLTPLQTVGLGVIAVLTFWVLLAFYGVIL
ncbi:ICP22 family protein [Natrarchaeobaculum sulfurireducens]|uniref:Uncharacterized protein n=1 Tax=Natrarchaeobaculum sulfurireducens TaxID=2044521 RepID=A0A346PHH1_9EURY|nr:hypothetical protein [Natrarchaeobaculum sulfurireducens]AXR78966.1 hypothetical protein AArc1_2653 [Natrarchaeobaculum sulfurireducens]